MLRYRGRAALRLLCVCALASVANVAGAAEASAPDDAAIDLDQAVQALKDEVSEFNRDASMAEDEFLYPPATRLTVYLSNSLNPLMLDEVQVTVDSGQPQRHAYVPSEARALLSRGALQPLLRTNVARGTHRVRISYKGHFAEEKKDVPVAGQFQTDIEKGLEPVELELRIVPGKRRGTADVVARQWRAAEQ